MSNVALARSILKICHLTGNFKLRSGKTSTEYFDKYRFETQPKLLKAIASELKLLIPKNTQVLAGLEMGGIPVATALSLETGLPVVFVRKHAKDYGTCKLAEGLESLEGLEVCIVEDVITTGGQVVMSAEDLRALGAEVNHVICVISRQQGGEDNLRQAGLKLASLFTNDQLKAAGKG
jgi:orotate phosphoribosyltransferase